MQLSFVPRVIRRLLDLVYNPRRPNLFVRRLFALTTTAGVSKSRFFSNNVVLLREKYRSAAFRAASLAASLPPCVRGSSGGIWDFLPARVRVMR